MCGQAQEGRSGTHTLVFHDGQRDALDDAGVGLHELGQRGGFAYSDRAVRLPRTPTESTSDARTHGSPRTREVNNLEIRMSVRIALPVGASGGYQEEGEKREERVESRE